LDAYKAGSLRERERDATRRLAEAERRLTELQGDRDAKARDASSERDKRAELKRLAAQLSLDGAGGQR